MCEASSCSVHLSFLSSFCLSSFVDVQQDVFEISLRLKVIIES